MCSLASSKTIRQIVESMSYPDKDFRYMAVNDLMTELQQGSTFDTDNEIKISKALLELLDDVNEEVQTNAVKCVSIFSMRLSEKTFLSVLISLVDLISKSNKQSHRIVCAIALKNIINCSAGQSNSKCISLFAKDYMNNFISIISGKVDDDVLQESMEICTELIERFGSHISVHHNAMMTCFQTVLSHPRQSIRKRAINAIGKLLISAPSTLYVNFLIQLAQNSLPFCINPECTENIVTRLQCFSVLAQRPAELTENISLVLPCVLEWRGSNNDAIKEAMLQALESFIISCGPAMRANLNDLIALFCQFLHYDPNYDDGLGYDEETNHDHMEVKFGEENEDDSNLSEIDEEEDDLDDDDESWKVRRASAKCLQACLNSYGNTDLQVFSKEIFTALLRRLKEREETVLFELFSTIKLLLNVTRVFLESHLGGSWSNLSFTPSSGRQSQILQYRLLSISNQMNFAHYSNNKAVLSVLPDLKALTSVLVQKISQLSGFNEKKPDNKSVDVQASSTFGAISSRRVRVLREILSVFRQLVHALPPGLTTNVGPAAFSQAVLYSQMPQLISLVSCILDSPDSEFDSNLRHEAMTFLSLLFVRHEQVELWISNGLIDSLIQLIAKNIGVSFLRISSEALNMAQIISPRLASLNAQHLAKFLYEPAYRELFAADRDFELKLQSIIAVTSLVAHNGKYLEAEIPNFLEMLCKRLDNEVTRIQIMKSLIDLLESPSNIDLSPTYPYLVQKITILFRQNDRNLRLCSLKCLECLWRVRSSTIPVELSQEIFIETPNALQETDAQILQFVLLLVGHALSAGLSSKKPFILSNDSKESIKFRIVDHAFKYLHSGWMHDYCLQAFVYLIGVLTGPSESSSSIISREELVDSLIRPIKFNELSLTQLDILHGISDCVAECYRHKPLNVQQDFINNINSEIKLSVIGPMDDQKNLQLVISLFTLGSLGRYFDPQRQFQLMEKLFDLILSSESQNGKTSFSGTEELKKSAATSLGKLGACSLSSYIHLLVQYCEKMNKNGSIGSENNSDILYFFLHSLKETLNGISYVDSENFCDFEQNLNKEALSSEQLFQLAESIWKFLISQGQFQNDTTRNLLGECMGKVILLQPTLLKNLIELILETANSAQFDPIFLIILFSAAKFSIWNQLPRSAFGLQLSDSELIEAVNCFDNQLLSMLAPGLKILQETNTSVQSIDLACQRAILNFLNTILHLRTDLVVQFCIEMQQAAVDSENSISAQLPNLLLSLTKRRRELIQLVEMGPFKHQQDAGLEIRKCAFECIASIMDKGIDIINPQSFGDALESGIDDHLELKHTVFLMIVRLCFLRPKIVYARVDCLLNQIRQIIVDKGKREAIKQEQDKMSDLKRSAVKVVAAISLVPDIEKNSVYLEFYKSVISTSTELKNLFELERKDLSPLRQANFHRAIC